MLSICIKVMFLYLHSEADMKLSQDFIHEDVFSEFYSKYIFKNNYFIIKINF